MKSCRKTRMENIIRWRQKIRESQNVYSQKRAIGLLLRAVMYGMSGPFQLTLKEASAITGASEMELDKLYQEHEKRRGHEYRYRWIYHTGLKMFYYDGG